MSAHPQNLKDLRYFSHDGKKVRDISSVRGGVRDFLKKLCVFLKNAPQMESRTPSGVGEMHLVFQNVCFHMFLAMLAGRGPREGGRGKGKPFPLLIKIV